MAYALVAVIFGLPGLIAGGGAAVLLLHHAHLARPGPELTPALLATLAWAGAGLAGCLAWLRLSVVFLHDPAAFRPAAPWWWLMLFGCLAALPVLWMALQALGAGDAEGGWLLLAGPSLWLPGALLWCWRRR